jgi:hypothetical protein
VILPGSVTRPLAAGTQPTDCRGGSYYLGDEGLELASMEFQPFELTEATVCCLFRRVAQCHYGRPSNISSVIIDSNDGSCHKF